MQSGGPLTFIGIAKMAFIEILKINFSRLSQGQQPDPVFDDQEEELLNDELQDGKKIFRKKWEKISKSESKK